MTLLVVSLVVSCAVMIGPSQPDVRESHTEVPSPSGKRIAIRDGYRNGEYFLSPGYYDTLTVSGEGQSEFIGKLPVGPAPQWLSDDKVLVTIDRMWIPTTRSRAFDVDIILHLGDGVHVESSRKELERYEANDFKSIYEGPNDRQACEFQSRNWQKSREFWTWAREATDNGDPDPGPWVNKYYPADCSTLSKR